MVDDLAQQYGSAYVPLSHHRPARLMMVTFDRCNSPKQKKQVGPIFVSDLKGASCQARWGTVLKSREATQVGKNA